MIKTLSILLVALALALAACADTDANDAAPQLPMCDELTNTDCVTVIREDGQPIKNDEKPR